MESLFAGGAGIALIVLAIIIALLWTFLPFAIFGFQKKLDQMMSIHKQTNRLLEDILIHQSEMSGVDVEDAKKDPPFYAKNVKSNDVVL